MALTVDEMKEKVKKKRSQAITGLINVIKTRDGSTSPPIEGQKDVDDFNLSMLFGASQNENIDWNNPGVEGLIRIYYHIIKEINGTDRDNIITNTNTSNTVNSSLNVAANKLLDGSFADSGFFKNVNNKPVFDTSSNSFTSNRESPNDDYSTSIRQIVDDIILDLGNKSSLGPHSITTSNSQAWENYIHDSIMGHRWSDVYPEAFIPGDPIYGDHDSDPLTPDEIIGYEDDDYVFGNGNYDKDDTINPSQKPSNWELIDHADYWSDTIETNLSNLVSDLTSLITYIQYSKTSNEDYFTNPNVILGRDESPQFNTQDGWISTIQGVIDNSQLILDELSNYPSYSNSNGEFTQASRRSIMNSLVENLKSSISGFDNYLDSIVSTLQGEFGSVSDPNTLRGLRFLWVKNIIDPNDGSKTSLNGLGTAIDVMESNISKAESEFGLYGLGPSEWIPTPNIAGIEAYYLPNTTTLELEPVGYLLAWEGQDHVTGYNVEKSTDWDGNTGTFSLILPTGNSYTVEEIDANTGRVLTYYIDEDVDILGGEKPYYRVKAFDNGGSGDSSRTAAQSATGDPKNVDDFPGGGETVPAIPGAEPTPDPITVPEIPDTVPEGTLIWTTILERDDAIDVDHKQYQSEVPFDSSGTNLVVYVNGELRNRGSGEDYTIIDYTTIEFNSPIQTGDEITMNVFIRNPDEPITSWKDPVDTFIQLPQQVNSDGDLRLVKDVNEIYRWDGDTNTWILISASSGDAWGQPVDTIGDLPGTGNDGEVRFIISEQSFYYYNASQSQWLNVAAQSMRWKDPVNTVGDLTSSGNTTGDVRLVLSESKLYLWDGSQWSPIVADLGSITITHSDLADMPDLAGIIADHDERYYTEDEIDITVSDLQTQIDALLNLVPSDADELDGTFRYSGTIFRTGYLSHNGGNFVTLVPEQQFTRITKDPNFILTNPDTTQFNDADKGVLRLYINDVEVDNFDLAAAFNESERNDGQTYPPVTASGGFLQIVEVTPYASYPTYQKGEFRIEIESVDLVPGENKIKLIHELQSGNRETEDLIIFWDNFTSQIGFQSIGVQHETISSTKYISGIRHYDIGDQLRIHFSALRLFDNTYTMPNQVKIDPNNFASDDYYINYQSPGSSGVAQPEPGEVLQYNNIITISNQDVYKVNPRLALTGYDPHGPSDIFYTPYLNILVNTYGVKSNDKNEYFVDEYYRLSETNLYDTIPTVINEWWNSQNILTTGQLQVYDGKLIYPKTNYSVFLPSQSVNYSGFSGSRYYIRVFKDLNPHNNGTFFIEGYNINDGNVKIELKLPSQTGWLDISKQYNTADFTGIDGDGCLINRSGYYLEWTSGGFSTADSGYLVVVRITMLNSNAGSISQISIDW